MSSNVGQNFPYASETETERTAAVARAVASFEGLGDKIKTESDPPEERSLDGAEEEDPTLPPRWWVYVCPRDDFRGRLHVAGYALERHALYTVCDTCGSTFLR